MDRDHADESVLSWLQGYRNPEESQADFRPGDPQQAALAQFISDHPLPADAIVVDFGSGRGLIAQMLKHVYRERQAPRYFAVDLPHQLDVLSIPNPIHNDSRKIEVTDFYASELKRWGGKIASVVVRNVLHELTIPPTCAMFQALNEHLAPPAVIYIQDITDLPRAEERNVGWRPELLIEFLQEVGIPSETFDLASFGGTNWFALTAHPTGLAIDQATALDAAIRAREKQKREMLDALSAIDARGSTSDFVREVKLSSRTSVPRFSTLSCATSARYGYWSLRPSPQRLICVRWSPSIRMRPSYAATSASPFRRQRVSPGFSATRKERPMRANIFNCARPQESRIRRTSSSTSSAS